MTKYCVVCDRDVEKVPIGEHEYVFFDIVQATTIMLGNDGLVDKKNPIHIIFVRRLS